MKLQQFGKKLKMSTKKNSPIILTAVGLTGMITSTVLAVKATPLALDLIREAEFEKGEELTKKEVLKATWKPYMPALGTAVFSIACIIGANSIHMRRSTALAAAYKLSQSALHEFKEKAVEVVGEKKVSEIKQKVNQDNVDKDPVSKSEVIITSKGESLMYDTISGRYFKSDIDKIQRIINELNRDMLSDMYISLNQFYSAIGLQHTKAGYDLGWQCDKGLIEVDFGATIADDGTPCITIDFTYPPHYGYDRLI